MGQCEIRVVRINRKFIVESKERQTRYFHAGKSTDVAVVNLNAVIKKIFMIVSNIHDLWKKTEWKLLAVSYSP